MRRRSKPHLLFMHSKFPPLFIRNSSSKAQWQQQYHHLLSHYHQIKTQDKGLPLHPSSLPPLLKACAKLQSYSLGISIHLHVIKRGLQCYTSIANSTMDFYVKCGFPNLAWRVFYWMENPDSVSWNVMLHGFLSHFAYDEGLDLFAQARMAGFEPNISSLVLVLRACRILGTTHEGENIHAFVIRSGLASVVSVLNSLLSFYGELCGMAYARKVFDEITDRDVISWSVIISRYAQSGEAHEAFGLFRDMCLQGVVAFDGTAMLSILQACCSIGNIDQGRSIHGQVIQRGFKFDMFVGNSLVDMYSKCLDTDSAYMVFNEMRHRNDVSWNSILSGFVHNGRYLEALELFDSMMKSGIELDAVTLVNLLQVCRNLGEALWCKCIHCVAIRRGFYRNDLVLNSLLDGYCKCGMVVLAWKLFKRIEKKNLISWSIMIGGLAHSGEPDQAIVLFQEMKLADEKPNSVTMLSLTQACSISADLGISRWAHAIVFKTGMANDVVVGTALLEMYGKCGEIDASKTVFDEMRERNVISWSAMIAAYGMNGNPHEALALFCEMELHGIKPNKVTILSLLSACSHGGLLEEGHSIFRKMIQDHGLEPNSEHYSCIVDMLGRAGKLNNAMEVIKNLPKGVEPSGSVWGALLSACRNHGDTELGSEALSHVLELEPSSSAGYLLASGMYAKKGLWTDASRIRRLVKEKWVRVVAGYSLVHVSCKAFKFVAGDLSHPQCAEIYAVIEDLHGCLKMEGRIQQL